LGTQNTLTTATSMASLTPTASTTESLSMSVMTTASAHTQTLELTPGLPFEEAEISPAPTWTPLPAPDEQLEAEPDWPVLILLVLQGIAILLGGAVFLRRH
jgi:hypothetical protein